MKKCYRCKLFLSLDKFSKNGYNSDGHQDRCKSCQKIARELVASNERRRVASWSKKNPEKAKNRNLKRQYGITLEEYKILLLAQNGKCAVCKSSETGSGNKYFAVDHDHKTTKVRALLCDRCNQALGHVKESIEILQALIEYLKKHSDLSSNGQGSGLRNQQ